MFRNDIPMTPEVKRHQTNLLIIFGIGLVLAICKVAGAPAFTLSEILVSMLFLCGVMYTNYCLLVFYIILTLYSMIIYFMEFGKLVQIKVVTGNNPFDNKSKAFYFFIVILGLTFVFDIFAIYFTFQAYRVFKYEAFKGSIGGTQPYPGQAPARGNDNRNAGNNRPAFQGDGIVL